MKVWVFALFVAAVSAQSNVRLVDAESTEISIPQSGDNSDMFMGRLQVNKDGTWGEICDRDLSSKTISDIARLACTELGMAGGWANSSASVGTATGIVTNNVNCPKTAANLGECTMGDKTGCSGGSPIVLTCERCSFRCKEIHRQNVNEAFQQPTAAQIVKDNSCNLGVKRKPSLDDGTETDGWTPTCQNVVDGQEGTVLAEGKENGNLFKQCNSRLIIRDTITLNCPTTATVKLNAANKGMPKLTGDLLGVTATTVCAAQGAEQPKLFVENWKKYQITCADAPESVKVKANTTSDSTDCTISLEYDIEADYRPTVECVSGVSLPWNKPAALVTVTSCRDLLSGSPGELAGTIETDMDCCSLGYKKNFTGTYTDGTGAKSKACWGFNNVATDKQNRCPKCSDTDCSSPCCKDDGQGGCAHRDTCTLKDKSACKSDGPYCIWVEHVGCVAKDACRANSKSQCYGDDTCQWKKDKKKCKAVGCENIYDVDSCNSTAACRWKEAKERCVPDICHQRGSDICMEDATCRWDKEDNFCHALCDYTGKSNCNDDEYCKWDSTGKKCDIKCLSQYTSKKACNADSKCYWNPDLGACKYVDECSVLHAKWLCQARGCEWKENKNKCSGEM